MKKFNLGDLKVQSFVTSENDLNADTLKGGNTFQVICMTPPIFITKQANCLTTPKICRESLLIACITTGPPSNFAVC